MSEPDTDALWAAEWENAHRVRDTAHENSAYRLHLSTNISPSKKKERRKGAGPNLQKEQIDRLEESSAPNFEGPQWARITVSVTTTLPKRSSPTPAMRPAVLLLLLIPGLLGFGMWTEFLQMLYASYSPVRYFRCREKCAECLTTWYPAVVYWKNI